MMDTLNVTVYNQDCEEWVDCGSVEVPKDLDDDMACLVGKGLVYESDWIPGSVTIGIAREDAGGFTPRLIYSGK